MALISSLLVLTEQHEAWTTNVVADKKQECTRQISPGYTILELSLLIASLLSQNSLVYNLHLQQALLKNQLQLLGRHLNNVQFPQEITRTPWTADPALPADTGQHQCPKHKQRWARIRPRLGLKPHQPSILSIFLQISGQVQLHEPIMEGNIIFP